MIQELFHIGSLSISPFGVTLVLAFFAAYWHLQRAMRRFDIGDQDTASWLLFGTALCGIVGAKIYYAVLYRDWHLLYDRAGIVFYGGFIGGTLAFFWMVYRYRLPLARTADAAAPALALGYGIGRVGCFLVGDDYGVPTDLPWGVAFKVGLPPTTGFNLHHQFGLDVPPDNAFVAVHPTQLYETAGGLLIWGFALYLMRREAGPRQPRPGTIGLTVVALLAVERFLVEFLRAKDDRFFGVFTLAQMISVAVLVTVAAIAVTAWRRRRAAAEA